MNDSGEADASPLFLCVRFGDMQKNEYFCELYKDIDMQSESKVIFERNSVEFVTVAAQYCQFLENVEGMEREEFIDTVLKILPLLYVKALLLPEMELIDEDDILETCVTEETYSMMNAKLADIMGDRDDYLDLFVEDMKYSDQPITRYISEGLADIYQDIKDFIFVFRQGVNRNMHNALATCQDNFKLYWGQKLVNTLRALHEVKYDTHREDDN